VVEVRTFTGLRNRYNHLTQKSDLETDRLYLTPSEDRIGIGRPSIGPFAQRKETGPILKINFQGFRAAIHWEKSEIYTKFLCKCHNRLQCPEHNLPFKQLNSEMSVKCTSTVSPRINVPAKGHVTDSDPEPC